MAVQVLRRSRHVIGSRAARWVGLACCLLNLSAAADEPLWLRAGGRTPQSLALIRVLCSAESYGLRSSDYLDCTRLQQLPGRLSTSGQLPPVTNTQFDAELTTAMV